MTRGGVMSNCPKCGHVFLPFERYCPDCGSLLPAHPDHAPNTPSSPFVSSAPLPIVAQPVRDSAIGRLAAILIAAAVIMLGIVGVLGSGILRQTTPPTFGTTPISSVGIVSPITENTPNPGATTPATGAACANVLPNSTPASAVRGYADVPFPAGATTQPIVQDSNTSGLYARSHVNACAPNLDTLAIAIYYTQAMTNLGWSIPTNAKVPYRFGGYMEHCSGWQSNLCWTKDAAPRYVSLENTQNATGGAVIFTLDLFTPPAPPQCPSTFTGFPYGPSYITVNSSKNLYIPMPPLTALYPQQDHSKITHYFLCSAGTAGTVSNFLQQTLPLQFWTQTSNLGNVQVWVAAGYRMTITLSDPTNWEIAYQRTGT